MLPFSVDTIANADRSPNQGCKKKMNIKGHKGQNKMNIPAMAFDVEALGASATHACNARDLEVWILVFMRR